MYTITKENHSLIIRAYIQLKLKTSTKYSVPCKNKAYAYHCCSTEIITSPNKPKLIDSTIIANICYYLASCNKKDKIQTERVLDVTDSNHNYWDLRDPAPQPQESLHTTLSLLPWGRGQAKGTFSCIPVPMSRFARDRNWHVNVLSLYFTAERYNFCTANHY